MDQNYELLEFIYQDAEMATFTLTELLRELNGKDNKIKKDVENILKGYERYLKDTKSILEKNGISLKPNGFMAKMGADMGIKKEVSNDNSDASIADMLIKGISMGSLDIEKKLKNFKGSVKKEYYKLGENFLEFQQDNITSLKNYL